ncbi:hypothetical protein ILFOPFJJ_06998 [Ensifer psoraleae]|nr:hypothetical protein [Sinorhizobium psoraleae]
MTYCLTKCLGVTLSDELARIVGQRLLVEPVLNGIFFVCEEPVAKGEKSTYIFAGGVSLESIHEPQNKLSIHRMKRAIADTSQKLSCLSRLRRRGRRARFVHQPNRHLIVAWRRKLLWPNASFLRRAVLSGSGVADVGRLHQCRDFGVTNRGNMALALHRFCAGLRFSEMSQCGGNGPIITGVLLIGPDIPIQPVAGQPISNAHLVVLTQVVTEAAKGSCIPLAGFCRCFVFILFDESRVPGVRPQLSAACDRHDFARRLPGPKMVYCRKEKLGRLTLFHELARIIGQRLVVEPRMNRPFVVFEEPAAKAEKSIYIALGGAFGGTSVDEGLPKPQNKGSIHRMKRAVADTSQKLS